MDRLTVMKTISVVKLNFNVLKFMANYLCKAVIGKYQLRIMKKDKIKKIVLCVITFTITVEKIIKHHLVI